MWLFYEWLNLLTKVFFIEIIQNGQGKSEKSGMYKLFYNTHIVYFTYRIINIYTP